MESKYVWVLELCDGCHTANVAAVYATLEAAKPDILCWFKEQSIDIDDVDIEAHEGIVSWYGPEDVSAELTRFSVKPENDS